VQQYDKTILIFSNMRYNSPIEATSIFLARELAVNNKVYYIEYPLTYKDYKNEKSSEAFQKRKDSFFNADDAVIDTEIPNLKRVALPILLPLNFLPEGKLYRAILKINESWIAKRLKYIIKKQEIKGFVFINAFNFYYPGVGKAIKPALTIYQCLDPMITPYDMKHGIVSELQLVKESDMVICSSKTLYNEKIKINPNTFFVPNAGELSHSSKALDKDLPIHGKLLNIKKPIIGYVGSIERRIDYELMKEVITTNPYKNFVFVGPMFKEHVPDWFFNTPNLHLLGPILYAELPQLFKGFDIAIIPFKKDEVSSTIFPLKLFEYLGAGKPVISTGFNPDLKEYTDDAVNYCDDAASFTKVLDDILANDNTEKLAKRLEVAKQNTWEIRAKQIMELIDKGLAAKA
jgi:teichuronic acid biosynthesis glycosyltransferase TuaH